MMGVYEVLNKVNGKRYIGQSSVIEKRWVSQRGELNGGRKGGLFQKEWVTFEEDNFSFNVLVICEEHELLRIERELIVKLDPEYNLLKPGSQSNLTAQEVREIRARYKRNVYGYSKLAADYNVTPGCIASIIKRRTWKYI